MKDEVLYRLFKRLLVKLLPILRFKIDNLIYPYKIDKYPTLNYNSNGMPRLNEYGTKTDIGALFSYGTPDIVLVDIDEYKVLFDYLCNNEIFRDFYTLDKNDNTLLPTSIRIYILNLCERYYYLFGSDFDELNFRRVYDPVENYLFTEQLDVDISLPILFVKFDFDEFWLNNSICIRRISDNYHLSRLKIKAYSPAITDALISSATHEVIFKNYHTSKGKKWYMSGFSDEDSFPMDLFNNFFNSIKLVTNINTGFAQILVYPQGWSSYTYADLPELHGTSVKRYPSYFDNFYWNNDNFPRVDIDEIKNVGVIFNQLIKNENNKLIIASRRLMNSYLRDNEEDSIIDIIIALELLLCDNEKSEITHRLSLRLAKLFSMFIENVDPIFVFENVKKIYDYRSAIVHGNTKINTKREIKLHTENKPIKTVTLANDYLREIILILLKHPEYIDPKNIDKKMIEK